jgi:hypothetical protein
MELHHTTVIFIAYLLSHGQCSLKDIRHFFIFAIESKDDDTLVELFFHVLDMCIPQDASIEHNFMLKSFKKFMRMRKKSLARMRILYGGRLEIDNFTRISYFKISF